MPAVFSLKIQNLLPENFAIIGVGRRELSIIDFRNKMKESILTFSEEKNLNENQIETFLENLCYCSMDNTSAEGF